MLFGHLALPRWTGVVVPSPTHGIMTKSTSSRGGSGRRSAAIDRLAVVLEAARATPEVEEAWETLDALAGDLQRPDEIAALYVEVLARDLPVAVASRIAERALRFHEEWYGERDPRIVEVLTRTLQIEPGAEWAFEKLTVVLTVGERWDELLSLYDRALADAPAGARRAKILQEAADIAKDFAGRTDRAIAYLEDLSRLRPGDGAVSSSLERLLERQSRFADLVAHWRARLAVLGPDEAAHLRGRIAEALLSKLDDPTGALEALRAGAPDDPALALLEKILARADATAAVRGDALGLLKDRYEALGRAEDLLRVLRAGQGFAATDDRMDLHRESGERLAAAGDEAGAMDHWASVLELDPADLEADVRLRRFAARTGRHAEHARSLATATGRAKDGARRAALFAEAATIHADRLADPAGAAGLWERAAAETDADVGVLRASLRRLEETLDSLGRGEDRLAVLERLAILEGRAADRRGVLGRAARLAAQLGQVDRALGLWTEAASQAPSDLEALGAIVELLAGASRPALLAEALLARAAVAEPHQRRADLVRAARIQDEIGSPDAALATWIEIRRQDGDGDDVVDALADLHARAGQWSPLRALLEGVAEREVGRAVGRLLRLADTLRERLDDPAASLARYVRAAQVDPTSAGARAGLAALLADPACKAGAVEALSRAHAATDDWRAALDLAAERLAVSPDAASGVAILRETARIAETRAADPLAAARALARALALAPHDESIEADLLRLAEACGAWDVAREAVEVALATLPAGSLRARGLRLVEGRILEERLGDASRALDAYADALAADPGRLDVAAAVLRAGARSGRWAIVARGLVASFAAIGRVDTRLLEDLETAAQDAGAWEELTFAMAEALAEGSVAPIVLRDLEVRLAIWYRDRRADPDAAEGALRRALGVEPRHLPTLAMLVDLLRRSPGRPLVEALLALGEADPADLDPLVEATTVARDRLREPDLAARSLERLLGASLTMQRGGQAARGRASVEAAISTALEGLSEVAARAKDHRRVVDLLVERAGRAAGPSDARGLLHQTAEAAQESLGDRFRAVDLHRQVLAATPDDRTSLAALARLYRDLDLSVELVSLHRHELGLGPTPARRIELRLEIARLLGEAQRRGGRVETLLENLSDSPGHEATVDAITDVLVGSSRHAELLRILTDQAGRVEASGDAAKAAVLWTRAADLAEGALGDRARAIECHERSVALAPAAAGFEALARIHLGRAEPGRAAKWLERILGVVPAADRTAAFVRLAQATLDAGDPAGATAWLEQAAAQDPASASVRDLLAERFRAVGAKEKLAGLLVACAPHVGDAETALAHSREIVLLHREGAATPPQAATVLERTRDLVFDDRWVQRTLAEMLRTSGRLDDARAVLESLLESYGRRRSEERAAVHLELGRVLHAKGEISSAMEQLELAAGMDVRSAEILRASAEVALHAKKYPQAERAYRALLLVVKQKGPAEAGVGAAQILHELSRIAAQKGEKDQSQDLLASAVTAVAESDDEAKRFAEAMLAAGEHAILERALRARLDRLEGGPAKAEVLASLATVLERTDRTPDALAALLDAIEAAPDLEGAHAAARSLSKRAGLVETYLDRMAVLIDRFRRRDDLALAGALLLRTGRVLEEDVADLGRAGEAYARAETTGHHALEALEAVARVATARGDRETAVRALRRMDTPGALYRLAEALLASPESMDEGLTALSAAVEREADYERASRILASAEGADASRVLPLLEWLARRSNDPRMLLDFLEKSAALPWARAQEVKEGVELARTLGEAEREERLMRRAVDLARSSAAGIGDASWAILPLARRRAQAGDLPGAVSLWEEAAGVLDRAAVLDLGLSLARAAEAALSVRVYERLLPEDPTRRDVWEPLARACREIGDVAALDRVAQATLPMLADAAERNVLRLELARLLVARGERLEEARDILRDVLMDEPDHVEAYSLLADLLERTGDEADLAELLERRLETARAERDAGAVAALSLRLGAFHARSAPDEAKAIYRAALEVAGDDPRLLAEILRLSTSAGDPPDRAPLAERLLGAVRTEDAERTATELADQAQALDDAAVLRIALERGVRAAPASGLLRGRLAAHYRQVDDAGGLADLLADEADRTEDAPHAAALLLEAAALRQGRLGDPRGAADLLARARKAAPTDAAVVEALAGALAAAGDLAAAAAEVGHALGADPAPGDRGRLLRLRADLRTRANDEEGALEDLEAAYSASGAEVVADLREALTRHRKRLAAKRDKDGVRRTTMRIAQVLAECGERDEARETVSSWLQQAPEDLEMLHLSRRLDEEDGRSEALAVTLARLVRVEEGEAQIEATVRLSQVLGDLARPTDARESLEHVLLLQPESGAIRRLLREVYEAVGARSELAELSLIDADHAPGDDARLVSLREAGRRLLDLDWADRAIEPLETAHHLRPDDPDTLLALIDAYTAAGRNAEAGEMVKKLLLREKKKKTPQVAALQLRMARVSRGAGDRAAEMDWLRQAFETDKNNGQVAAELADLAEAQGNDELALKALQTLTLMKDKAPVPLGVAYFRQAKIAARRGERQRAVLWARRALVEDEAHDGARALLKDLGEN